MHIIFTTETHDCRERLRPAWAMQEVEHQKQALEAMHGVIAERAQRNSSTKARQDPRPAGKPFGRKLVFGEAPVQLCACAPDLFF